MTQFLGGENDTLLCAGDSKALITVKEAFAAEPRMILLYFSMHDCPPCREFTPLLAELYHECNESEKTFEVVFFSGDATKDLYTSYVPDHPWLVMPYQDARIKAAAVEFKVKGMPHLVVLSSKGELLSRNGIKEIIEEGPEAIAKWAAKC